MANVVPKTGVLRILSGIFYWQKHGDISKFWLCACSEGFIWANKSVAVINGGQQGCVGLGGPYQSTH